VGRWVIPASVVGERKTETMERIIIVQTKEMLTLPKVHQLRVVYVTEWATALETAGTTAIIRTEPQYQVIKLTINRSQTRNRQYN